MQDSIALLLLLFVAVPFAPPVTWLRGATLLLAVLATGLLVMLVAFRRYGTRPLRFSLRPLAKLPGFSPARIELAAAGILRGLSGLRSPSVAFASFSLTLIYWLGFSFSFMLALRAVGLELGLDAGILISVATTFSLLLPSLPASIGIFEAAVLVALAPYGVDDAQALSGAVVIHVLTFVPFLILGPLALRGHATVVRRQEVRARRVRKRRERLRAGPLVTPAEATSRPRTTRIREPRPVEQRRTRPPFRRCGSGEPSRGQSGRR